ncbi:AraC family transcriptional regulator ligand-binding domain-containing protein [Niveispirillum sp. KHB5.9]|uniref:AraC family transcriptional regulator n=1 Tax=Niveispirillum sp. KHB5.9 TaxID=3400269 RepID=UPI003A8C6F33
MEEESTGKMGLDGEAVRQLLQGAVLKGADPQALLRAAAIDPSVYGNRRAAIDGKALVRLIRRIQFTLDDVYLGFFAQGCRLALETERLLSFLHCTTLGEALRVSIRFTDAMCADVGPGIREEHGAGLQHICKYQTVAGVNRDILVWVRFVWIYQLFSWLIGRPLALRGLSVRGSRPVQENGFDRFALFCCPVQFDAPVDALSYDWGDLTARLVHNTINEYDDYYASEPDWFAILDRGLNWRERTQQVLIDFQRAGLWSVPVEVVAARLRTRPRRLRHDLSLEGENFQDMRTRLRGELAAAYLLASDMPITEIGFTVGFSEPGSFSRHFCAWAGMSPSAYRTAHIGDPAKVGAATVLLNDRRII